MLGTIQLPVQFVLNVLIVRVTQAGHKADYSPPSIAEVKNVRSYISIPPYQWHTQEFFSEGVQQIQLRTEDGDLGAVAP